MADCVALRESSGYNDISFDIKRYDPNLPSLYVDNEQQYNNVKQKIQQALNRISNLRNALDGAVAILEAQGCSASSVGANSLYGELERLERGISQNESTLETIWENEKEKLAASQKATTTQNNAGNGSPGSAASASGATGATSPAAVAGATGPATVATAVGATGPIPIAGASGVAGSTGAASTSPISNTNSQPGIPSQTKSARAQASLQDTTNFQQRKDWRVRLALSPGAQQAKYLYYSDNPGILAPLQGTDGVIFPYTPTINVTYGASYNSVMPVHSNYKIFQYESSSVDSISITCDFTAQDTEEANYVLAVIHFFRSVTKMFYGQDEFPKPGTPPPLCYLFGLGEFQFNAHPLAITNFQYNLPPDVDYIRAGALTLPAGVSRASPNTAEPKPAESGSSQGRLQQLLANLTSIAGKTFNQRIKPGGKLSGPTFNELNSAVPAGTKDPTYVPTKINISISAVPIVSRYDISNRFSLQDYASGKLLNGVKQAGGGIW